MKWPQLRAHTTSAHIAESDTGRNVLDEPRSLKDFLVLLRTLHVIRGRRVAPASPLVDLQERVTNMLNKQSQNLARD